MADRLYIPANYLLTALWAAKEAGLAILDVYQQDFEVSYKEDQSPLTIADQRSHNIIVNYLTDSTGESIPILSEEGKDVPFEERREWEYFWLIDPLDGTKEFVKKNGEFTVNIALIHQARPILGVIYAPVINIFYFAFEEFGTYRLNGNDASELLKGRVLENKEADVLKAILEQSDRLPNRDQRTETCGSQLTIIGSRSHSSKEFKAFVEDMKKKHAKVELISAGSSLKLCLVAERRADIYPRLGPTMEWDTAAGQAIVEQARGSVLNCETGEPLRYNKENLLNPWFIVKTHGNW